MTAVPIGTGTGLANQRWQPTRSAILGAPRLKRRRWAEEIVKIEYCLLEKN